MAIEKRASASSRWLDWISLFLLLATLTVLTFRLAATGWVLDLVKIQNILPLACILGAWVGFSRFTWRLALTVGIVYGLVTVFWLIGTIFHPTGLWVFRMEEISVRLVLTWREIQTGHPAGDPILFYVLAALLVWILAYGGAYFMVRKGVSWPYLVPGMALFLIIDRFDLFYRNRSILYLVFSLLAIMSIARMYLLHQRRSWSGMGSENAAEAELDLTRITVILTLALVISISLLPGAATPYNPAERALNNTSQAWGRIRRQLANLFAPLKSSSSFGTGYYSDELPLGTNANQSEAPALEIKTSITRPENYRFFWRARTYDYYSNGTWSSSAEPLHTEDLAVSAREKPAWLSREEQTFNVTVRLDDLGMLYTEQNPHQTSVSVQQFIYPNNPLFLDVDRLEVDSVLGYGEKYSFRSDLARPGVQQLMEAQPVNPEDFPMEYVQIPVNLPARVTQLANQITSSKNTTYEKVQAIIVYLRTQMQYRTSVDPTPLGHDPVDYFLFDSKAGFCNYYASSAVILLRSIGIPSRLVVGFSEGEYDDESGIYTIRMIDSHAWPEVFFNGFGWIPFEPTSIQAEYSFPETRPVQPVIQDTPLATGALTAGTGTISTPSGNNSRDVAKDEDPGITPRNQPVTRPIFWIFPTVILILAGVYWILYSSSILIWIVQALEWIHVPIPRISAWSRGLNLASNMDRALLLPELALVLGGLETNPVQTPRERLSRWQTLFPEIRQNVELLLNSYEQSIYRDQRKNETNSMAISQKIYQYILPRMIFRRLRMKW